MTVTSTPIPANNLTAQFTSIRSEIDEAIGRVLAGGEFERGDELWAFEDEFAAFCEVSYAVGVGSGYASLFIALRTLGVEAGHEVITVPNTDIATCSAISHCGARIVWADVEYVPPLHLQLAYRELGFGPGAFPVAERLAGELLCLPVYPELSREQVERVADTVLEAIKYA